MGPAESCVSVMSLQFSQLLMVRAILSRPSKEVRSCYIYLFNSIFTTPFSLKELPKAATPRSMSKSKCYSPSQSEVTSDLLIRMAPEELKHPSETQLRIQVGLEQEALRSGTPFLHSLSQD